MMISGKIPPVLFAYHKLWQMIDLLYPPVCGGCGRPGTRWCEDCAAVTRIVAGPLCPVCSLPLPHDGKCPDCNQAGVRGARHFRLRSWAAYDGPLRNAIHRLKYNQDVGLAEVFVQYMIKGIQELGWYFDMVIPVPLGESRKKERGYNQSALFAWPIAVYTQRKYIPKALARQRETITQTKLNAAERRKNVYGAFLADPQLVQGKAVLLVDDLATTCSTIEACAEALTLAGAKSVFAYTLARTL